MSHMRHSIRRAGPVTAEELESAVKPRGGRNAPPPRRPGTI